MSLINLQILAATIIARMEQHLSVMWGTVSVNVQMGLLDLPVIKVGAQLFCLLHIGFQYPCFKLCFYSKGTHLRVPFQLKIKSYKIWFMKSKIEILYKYLENGIDNLMFII